MVKNHVPNSDTQSFKVLNITNKVVAVAEWLAKHSRGVNFAGGEIGTSRSGSLYRSVGVITYVGAPYD